MNRIYREPGLTLIKLGRYGLNIGRGFTGYASLRRWPWALYDFADHVSVDSDRQAWADGVLSAGLPGIGYAYECWKCGEWHNGTADTMEQVKAIRQDLNVKVKVIG